MEQGERGAPLGLHGVEADARTQPPPDAGGEGSPADLHDDAIEDGRAGGSADGTKIQLWTCNGTGAQQWTYSAGHDLVNPQANKCLDVTGNNSANATRLQIWTCTGAANQRWTAPA